MALPYDGYAHGDTNPLEVRAMRPEDDPLNVSGAMPPSTEIDALRLRKRLREAEKVIEACEKAVKVFELDDEGNGCGYVPCHYCDALTAIRKYRMAGVRREAGDG